MPEISTYEIVTLFVFGLILLIKGGDWFVDGACGIAKRFHLPEILIGATVVSIGTTLPEVMVSSIAAASGNGETAYGNALGSIICNTSLIAAVTLAVRPARVDKKTFVIPVIAFAVAFAVYATVAYAFGRFDRVVGIILLVLFVAYMVFTVWQAIKHPEPAPELLEDKEEEKCRPFLVDLMWLVIGAGLIVWGADLLVDNGMRIAEIVGVPESVIALTFVALGTSLPELVTAITSLVKGHSSLSLGNIIGANLFNLVLVSGMATTIGPFDVPSATTLLGVPSSLVMEIPLAFAVMAILVLPPLVKKGKMYRWQGILLLAIYVAFCAYQFTA